MKNIGICLLAYNVCTTALIVSLDVKAIYPAFQLNGFPILLTNLTQLVNPFIYLLQIKEVQKETVQIFINIKDFLTKKICRFHR